MLPFTLMTNAKLAQYHHMTSRQKRDFSHITAESPLTPSQGALPPLQLETDHRRHRFHLVLVSDITLVHMDPLVLEVLGSTLPCSYLQTQLVEQQRHQRQLAFGYNFCFRMHQYSLHKHHTDVH